MGSLSPGTIVGGDYEIVRPLSAGGMGEVFVARQRSTGRERALKIMQQALANDEGLKRRFEQEARVGSQIDSEHVVEVVGAGVDPAIGAPWLAMELLEGEDLERYLHRAGAIDPAQTLELFEQICHGVGAAHDKQVVHRDLKPENLFLARARRAGMRYTVKILDFGIAKLLGQSATASTNAMGTPLWMSPEQTQHNARITPATDVWPLGLIAFRALSGKNFWLAAADADRTAAMILREILIDPVPLASVRSRELGGAPIGEALDRWFSRCLARDPNGRFRDANELLHELRQAVGYGTRPHAQAELAWSPGATIASSPQGLTAASYGAMPSYASTPAHAQGPYFGGIPVAASTGSYGTPPPAMMTVAPRKSNTGLVVGVSIGLALCVGAGAVAYIVTRPDEKPSDAAESKADREPKRIETPTHEPLTPTATATAAIRPNPFESGQIWKGTYLCSQGVTNLALKVSSANGDQVDAVFDFVHPSSGAAGSFHMSGVYDEKTRALRLHAGPWIKQPPNYMTVDMDGAVSTDRTTFSGIMLNESCGKFEVVVLPK